MRKMLLSSIVSAVLVSGCGAVSLNATQSPSHDPSSFTYTRIYCTPDTESHFENVAVGLAKISFAPPAPPIYIGGKRPATSAFFGGFDPHWGSHDLEDRLNHPAPANQFVTFLAGVVSITTTDGETRRFRAGDVLWTEDTAPCKGHIFVVGDKPAFLMFAR